MDIFVIYFLILLSIIKGFLFIFTFYSHCFYMCSKTIINLDVQLLDCFLFKLFTLFTGTILSKSLVVLFVSNRL